MSDPYEILGVARTASQDEIKKAYRALAKKLHPDVNPGDKAVEQRFKEVSTAYDLLSDKERRRQFDAGEIGADGSPIHHNPFRHQYRKDSAGGFDFGSGGIDIDDLFSDLFGRGRRTQARRQASPKGQDLTFTVTIPFFEAMRGGSRRVSLFSGKTLDVNLPPGAEDGQRLRLKGQGMPSPEGGAAGDAFVEIQVEPHPYMRREGLDIHLDLPVTLHEAALGAKVKVPTINGMVSATIPPGSNSGTVLRLKGRGIMTPKGGRRGDQYVKLQVTLPDEADDKLAEFLRSWKPPAGYSPRKKLKLD
jgi:DnaJ-class molecular chaperone